MRLAILILPALLLTACVTEDATPSQESTDCSLIDSSADEDACRAYEKTKAKDAKAASDSNPADLAPNN